MMVVNKRDPPARPVSQIERLQKTERLDKAVAKAQRVDITASTPCATSWSTLVAVREARRRCGDGGLRLRRLVPDRQLRGRIHGSQWWRVPKLRNDGGCVMTLDDIKNMTLKADKNASRRSGRIFHVTPGGAVHAHYGAVSRRMARRMLLRARRSASSR